MFAALLLVAAGGLRADLVKNSPFLPPQNAAATTSSNSPIQYIGWMETAEGQQFRIFDPARKVGVWLKVSERDSNLDVALKQHDAEHDTLTVEHGGQTLTLSQRVSKVVSSGPAGAMAMPPPQPMPMPNVAPAVTQSVVLNPTPADEQRRLEAVAAEVARRRALREQAQQQINQGAMPPVAVPQVQPTTRQQLQQQGQAQGQQGGRQRGNRQQR